MSIIQGIKKLFLPERSGGEIALPAHQISRRKFFSFFGAGVAMVAAPGLLKMGPFGTPLGTPNMLGPVIPGAMLTPALRAEFARSYGENLARMQERIFFHMLTNPEKELLPNVPEAADGAVLFAASKYGERLNLYNESSFWSPQDVKKVPELEFEFRYFKDNEPPPVAPPGWKEPKPFVLKGRKILEAEMKEINDLLRDDDE